MAALSKRKEKEFKTGRCQEKQKKQQTNKYSKEIPHSKVNHFEIGFLSNYFFFSFILPEDTHCRFSSDSSFQSFVIVVQFCSLHGVAGAFPPGKLLCFGNKVVWDNTLNLLCLSLDFSSSDASVSPLTSFPRSSMLLELSSLCCFYFSVWGK